MKIVIAPDSFKDSISARDAAEAIAGGLASVLGDSAELIRIPIADGGEGTLDALTDPRDRIRVCVKGPLFDPVEAVYGFFGDTAVIEMASAAGLMLLPPARRCAARTTTFGVGELIRHAYGRGFRKILLTVGGSATNDGGCGMLAALGAVFRDENGERMIPTGGTLTSIASIELADAEQLLRDCSFRIATDVKNPLLGSEGATMVYGRQKGANDRELAALEVGMRHYAESIARLCGRDIASIAGSGAGGGIGVPLIAVANAEIGSGIETVLEMKQFSQALKSADLVITGEGRLDLQSLWGKAISGVANAAKAQGVPICCMVGCLGSDREELLGLGLADIFEVASLAESVDDSMKNAARYLFLLAAELARRLM